MLLKNGNAQIVTKKISDTELYYKKMHRKWLEEALLEIQKPFIKLVPIFGQVKENGSWSLLAEHSDRYEFSINVQNVMLFEDVFQIQKIWNLPQGIYLYMAIINNGTRGVKCLVTRD